jgi:hypothetical protein
MRHKTAFWCLLGAAIAAGCTDQSSKIAPTSAQSAISADQMGSVGIGDSLPAGYIVTPAGLYHHTCVHQVDSTDVVRASGEVRHKDGTVEQYPPCAHPVYPLNAFSRSGFAVGRDVIPPTTSGWVEADTASAGADSAYFWLIAYMHVPTAPSGSYSGTQLYYTFMGIQPSRSVGPILQPVLQWGYNGSFGGSYWSIASWSCGSSCYHSSSTTAYDGDSLEVEIHGSSAAWFCANSPNNCYGINIIDNTTSTSEGLTYNDNTPYRWLATAVETYGLTACNQYPGDPVRYNYFWLLNYYAPSATSIPLLGGSQSPPSWGAEYWSQTPSCNYSVSATADTVKLYHH